MNYVRIVDSRASTKAGIGVQVGDPCLIIGINNDFRIDVKICGARALDCVFGLPAHGPSGREGSSTEDQSMAAAGKEVSLVVSGIEYGSGVAVDAVVAVCNVHADTCR